MEIDVKRLRELLAKATPGPWQAMNEYQWDTIIGDIDGPDEGVMHYVGVADITDHDCAHANAALIVAMHAALPELLRVYEAWQAAPVGRLYRDSDDAGEWMVTPDMDDPDAPAEYHTVRLLTINPNEIDSRLIVEDSTPRATGERKDG